MNWKQNLLASCKQVGTIPTEESLKQGLKSASTNLLLIEGQEGTEEYLRLATECMVKLGMLAVWYPNKTDWMRMTWHLIPSEKMHRIIRERAIRTVVEII